MSLTFDQQNAAPGRPLADRSKTESLVVLNHNRLRQRLALVVALTGLIITTGWIGLILWIFAHLIEL